MNLLGLLKHIGPGAIVASATIGAGETVLAVRAGAWARYDLLWLVLLAVLTKSLLTLYMLGRYAAASGEPVANRLVQLPGPRGWLLWTVLLLEGLVAPAVFVVIAVPCGQLMGQILSSFGLSVSYKWLALLFVSMAIIVGMIQQYQTLEKSQVLVCLVLMVGTVVATLLVRPDVWETLKGFVNVGRFPSYPDWLPAEVKSRSPWLEMSSVFGYAGSIPMNYIVYSNWVLLKGWEAGPAALSRQDLRRTLAPLRWDVGFNAVLVLLVTTAFMVAGAAILNPLHRIPTGFDLLTEQAHIFARISAAMIPVYYVTILAALWGTLNSLPDIYARGAHSILTQTLPAARNLTLRTVMNVFGLTMLALTWLLIWTETTPIILIDLVALFSTNIGVGLTCFAAVWLDGQLPPERRVARPVWWATLLSAAVIAAMSLISAREVVGRYL
ncbi:MAG: Nramp family divalent metal transporter [Acidobacteriota bacterium]